MGTTTNLDPVYPSSDYDDAYDDGSTLYLDGYTYLNMGHYTGTTDCNVGIRFTGLTIPSGVTISSAHVQFMAYASLSGTCNLRIYGQQSNNANEFSTHSDFVGRTKTTAYKDWSVSAWTSSDNFNSEDISNIIQELVNDYGGLSSANVVIFFNDNGSGTNGYRNFYSYYAGMHFPELHISYTSPTNESKTLKPLLGIKTVSSRRLAKISNKLTPLIGLKALRKVSIIKSLKASIGNLTSMGYLKGLSQLFNARLGLLSFRAPYSTSKDITIVVQLLSNNIFNTSSNRSLTKVLNLYLGRVRTWRNGTIWGWAEDLISSIGVISLNSRNLSIPRNFSEIISYISEKKIVVERDFTLQISLLLSAFEKVKESLGYFVTELSLTVITYKDITKSFINQMNIHLIKFFTSSEKNFTSLLGLNVIKAPARFIHKVKKRKIDILNS